MFRAAYPCLFACAVLFSVLPTDSQVLSRSDSGFTTPEAFQLLANGKSKPVTFDFFLSSLSAQDVDGDGKVDLLVTGIPSDSNLQGPITTTLLRNIGDGGFTQVRGNNPAYCLPAPVYWGPTDQVAPFCTLADLNGDGRPDKIFAVEYPNSGDSSEVDYPTIKVELATGPGTYAAPQRYVLGGRHAFIAAVATGDFNGDGRQDIAVLRMTQQPDAATQRFYGSLTLLMGDSQGGFTPSQSYPTGVYDYFGQNPPSGSVVPDLRLAALDLNGDGKSDLIVYAGSGTSPYAVFLGGAQEPTQELSSGPSPFTMLVPADLNHDSFGDLLAVEKDGAHALFGGGAHSSILGYFSRDLKLSLDEYGASVVTLAADDFNGDGLPDILVQTNSALSIFLQQTGGTFSDPAQYTTGSYGPSVIADINNDGSLDLVVPGDPLVILYGDGHGSFSGSRLSGNLYGGGVVTGDFNRDGNADVAIVTPQFSTCPLGGCVNVVSVFEGSGHGWFGPPKQYPVASTYPILAVGDVNGDGILDLLVEGALPAADADDSGPDTVVLPGRKDGTFGAPINSTVGLSEIREIQDVFLVDVNNDGKLDLVTDAGVALGNGDGTFGAPIAFSIDSSANQVFTSIAVGDFTGDGKTDVILSTSLGITVLVGDGTGHFTAGQTINPGCSTTCYPLVAAGKLNSDASLDFVAAVVDPAGVTHVITYLNDGSGTFHAAQQVSLTEPYFALSNDALIAIAVADFTGDGINDVIVQAGPIGILPGKGDGTLAAPIAFDYDYGVFGDNDFAIADFNNDGMMDVVMPAGNGFGRLINTGRKSWPAIVPTIR